MVVVGIIGILSAVAIPNFRKYQAKSKTTEAKLHLAAIYTAEQSFFADYDTYAVCLTDMGYDPTTESTTRYYATGFSSDVGNTTRTYAVANGAACAAYASGFGWYPAGKTTGSGLALASAATWLPAGAMAETTFTVGAGGVVDKAYLAAATCDKWTINNLKKVVHSKTGY